MSLSQIRIQVEQARGKFDRLQSERDQTVKTMYQLEEDQCNIEQARVVFQTVAQQTQAQLEYFITDIVSLALTAVLDNPYQFKTEFVLKRGKTECEFFFEREGQTIKPLDASGGGSVDVASFALRCSLWSLNKNRPVLVLDEPFKHLSKNLHPKALQMLKEVSEKLGIQIILITHSEELVEDADKIFNVKLVKGVSYISS